MSLIETAVRGGAFFLLVLVAALLLRDARRVPAGLYGALFALGVAAYVVVSASAFAVSSVLVRTAKKTAPASMPESRQLEPLNS